MVVPVWCLYVEIPSVSGSGTHQTMVSSRKYFGFETTAFYRYLKDINYIHVERAALLRIMSIGIIHETSTCTSHTKFTTNPCLCKIFSNLAYIWVVFMRVFFTSLLLWEFVQNKICNLHCKSKAWW